MATNAPWTDIKRSTKKRHLILIITGAIILLLAGYHAFTVLIYPGELPQQAVHLLADAPLPEKGQKVLVYSPHPVYIIDNKACKNYIMELKTVTKL